eukprot:10908136-Alexandrium_andersonii.AAC.2
MCTATRAARVKRCGSASLCARHSKASSRSRARFSVAHAVHTFPPQHCRASVHALSAQTADQESMQEGASM